MYKFHTAVCLSLGIFIGLDLTVTAGLFGSNVQQSLTE
jgi:hypothetical protein